MSPLAFRSATDLARRLRAGRLRSADLLETYLDRIERHNPALNAIILADLPGARRRARAADRALARGAPLGPLHGLPITVKEAFDVTGMPTTWGLPALRTNIAARNALAVDRLLAAGAVLVGKTNVPVMLADWQTVNPIYGLTRNPWNLERAPGGSSGGSAAALAAGLTALEIGSDIGGSIRNPAHACGLYGHKSSHGLVPSEGHSLPGNRAPLDINSIGPLARSAADLDLALDVLAGPADVQSAFRRLDLPRARQSSLAQFRVGLLTDSPQAPVDDVVRAQLESLGVFLARAKAKVSRAASPKLPHDEVYTLYVHMLRAATSAAQNDDAAFAAAVAAAERLAPDDRSYYADQLRGNTMRHRDWLVANERRRALAEAWRDYFRDYDLLLCPAAPTVAFPHDHAGERWQREVIVNGARRSVNEHLFWAGYAGLFHLPATVAPIGIVPSGGSTNASAGLPVGVQIIGPPGGDRTCIRFARLLERAYHRFTPPPAFDD